MAGVDALEAAYANTYRGSYVGKVGSSHEHWAAAVKLVQKVPMFRAERRWALDDLDEQSARLLKHVRGVLHEA